MLSFLSTAALLTALLALAAPVLAWTAPSVQPNCAPDENSYAWTVTLSGKESNYNFDWSFNEGFSTFTTVNGSQGDNDLVTPRGDTTLYVRWSSDHASKTSAAANTTLCEQSTPTPTPNTDIASLYVLKTDESGAPLQGAVFSLTGPNDEDYGTFTTDQEGDFCVTGLPQNINVVVTENQPPDGYVLPDPASQTVAVDNDGDCLHHDVTFVDSAIPTPTPESSVEAATPTPTPESSVEAATASPAASVPNTAVGSNPSGPTGGTLLFALVLVLGMSGLALANVRAQRRR